MGHNLVAEILNQTLRKDWIDREAVREGEATLLYSELDLAIRKRAAVLSGLGVVPGQRVAIFSPDCLESALAILAALTLGAVALPVGELSAPTELRNRLNNAEAQLVLVHSELRTTLEEIRAEVPCLSEVMELSGESSLAAKSADKEPAAVYSCSEDAPALLLYSAGASMETSEEGPRGVLHSHSSVLRAFASFGAGYLELGATDRVFSTVRMSTAYGLGTGLLFPLLAGAGVLLVPGQAHSESVFHWLTKYEPTIFAATPSLYGQLARDATAHGHAKILSKVRSCLAGAESMPPKVIAMVRGVLGSNVTVGYGLTEAFQFVIAGEAAGRRPGNCGKLLSGINARIVDDAGEVVGTDEIGTLQLSADTVVGQYWRSDKALAEDGWFTTLDRFMADEEGNFYHCGRIDHLFKVGGKWVAPAEVEAALLANEAVWECAVIGADDEDGLIKPFAFVVPNLGQSPGPALEAELREYVKKELAPYKYPRWIEFVDELPKGPAGVILRYTLRDRLKRSRQRRLSELPMKA